MSTIKQRKKLSKGSIVLIGGLGLLAVVLVVLHFVGVVNLNFVGEWAIAIVTFGTASGWNAAIVLAAPFVLGILFFYALKAYIIGETVTTNVPGAGYNPTPVYPTTQPAQSGKETTIS